MVRRTVECYLLTVGTSKGSRIQYIYVGSIRCLGECWTVYKMYHTFCLALLPHALFTFAFRCKPGFIKTESYVVVQRTFRKKFELKRHDSVPASTTIFWETSAVTSVGAVGRKRSVQTVENCKTLQTAVEETLWTSLR